MQVTYGPWGETLGELAAAAAAAEGAGARTVWASELHRSAVVSAAACAQATSTAKVGTAVALAFSRSPLLCALEAMDLDELSSGRFVLGLGTGTRRVVEDWHNGEWGKPASHLRETVGIVRRVTEAAGRGERVTVAGEWESIDLVGWRRPFAPVRSRIPVYLAGMGPGMTALAGEIGDGWISHELTSPGFLRARSLPALREGLDRRPDAVPDFDVVASMCCAVGDDPRQARRDAAGLVGFYASVRTYADFFAFHGYAAVAAVAVELRRAGASPDALADAVPDAMVEALCAAGGPDDVRRRLLELAEVVDTVKLTPPTHGLPPEATRAAQGAILELLADIGGTIGPRRRTPA